jgi:hypothetical protein
MGRQMNNAMNTAPTDTVRIARSTPLALLLLWMAATAAAAAQPRLPLPPLAEGEPATPASAPGVELPTNVYAPPTPPAVAAPIPAMPAPISAVGEPSAELSGSGRSEALQRLVDTLQDRAHAAERSRTSVFWLALLAAPVGFAAGALFARYKNYQQLNVAIRALMERGVAVPPELLTPLESKGPAWSDRRKGILLFASGLGTMFLLAVGLGPEHGVWSLGLLPVFVGLAYLVLARLERKPNVQ